MNELDKQLNKYCAVAGKIFMGLFFITLLSVITENSYAEINFKDPRPSSPWRYGDIVDCSIIVEGYVTETDTVAYRLANKNDEIKFEGVWQYNASRDEETFTVTVDSTTYKRFYPGDDNEIQWLWSDGTDTIISDSYRVKINEQNIYVRQPRPDTYSTLNPFVEVELTGEMGKENLSAAVLRIKGPDADETFSYPEDNNFDFEASSNKLIYKNNRDFLAGGNEYSLYLKVEDSRYIEYGEVTSSFKTGEDIISDFINYPNPFDNKKNVTNFRYVLNDDAKVTINIYDTSRNLIKSLIRKENRSTGINEEIWEGNTFSGNLAANGIYFAEIIVKNNEENRKYLSLAIYTE